MERGVDKHGLINFIYPHAPFFKSPEGITIGEGVDSSGRGEIKSKLVETNGPVLEISKVVNVDKYYYFTLPSGWKLFTFTRKGIEDPMSHLQIRGFYKDKGILK